jgi:hypothetical protein
MSNLETARRRGNAHVPLTRFTIQASVSSYSALPVFIWRLPITPIAGSTAQWTAAINIKICKRIAKQTPARAIVCDTPHRS